MTKVKICGLRRLEDIDIVNSCLPDYAGFVFAESKRKVSLSEAENLIKSMDKRIIPVGVFVDEDIKNILEKVKICGIKVIQLHGCEDTQYVKKLKEFFYCSNLQQVEIWKAVRVLNEDSLELLGNFDVEAYVLDSFSKDSFGGTGKRFDWKLAKEILENYKLIIAGGLNCENVSEVLDLLKPYAVDVSSGVENEGVKDELLVRSFISEVRKKSDFGKL